MPTLTPAETHAERRCAPLDRPPASYRDGTRSPDARRASKNLRALHDFKAARHV